MSPDIDHGEYILPTMDIKLSLHDGREETTEGVDYLIECPVCEQYRHKSWFRAGVRGCARCEYFQSLWIDELATRLMLSDQKRQN